MEHIPSGEYTFLPVDKVLFGPGCVERLPYEIERLGCERALLVTSGSIAARTPLVGRIESLLGDRSVGVFGGARQHTPSGVVTAVRHAAEAARADVIISLGGGSVIDAAKGAVLSLAGDRGHVLPHVALPTTLSASEFSPLFGVTDEATKVKAGGNDALVTPRVVFLDGDLTSYTPDWLWLASGVRALDHAVETVYAPDHQPATDAPALDAITMLFACLPASTDGPGAGTERQRCQIASWLSFFGVANITLGLSHILGREIGPRYDVPHGYTSAVLLPKVMAYLLPQTRERQILIARAAGIDQPRAEDAAAAIFDFVSRLGLPQRLRDLGVPESDLKSLAAGREGVLHILREAW